MNKTGLQTTLSVALSERWKTTGVAKHGLALCPGSRWHHGGTLSCFPFHEEGNKGPELSGDAGNDLLNSSKPVKCAVSINFRNTAWNFRRPFFIFCQAERKISKIGQKGLKQESWESDWKFIK